MPRTVRKYWGPLKGRVPLNFNWPPIEANSIVVVTACEYLRTSPPSETFVDQNNQRFVGAANVTVSNVAPHGPPWDANHGITFVVNIDWPDPILIATDITVLDSLPEVVQN
jgi:hypothetical protein